MPVTNISLPLVSRTRDDEQYAMDAMTNEGGPAPREDDREERRPDVQKAESGTFNEGKMAGRTDALAGTRPLYRIWHSKTPTEFCSGYVLGYAEAYKERNSDRMRLQKAEAMVRHGVEVMQHWYDESASPYVESALVGLRALFMHAWVVDPPKDDDHKESMADRLLMAAYSLGRWSGTSGEPMDAVSKARLVEEATVAMHAALCKDDCEKAHKIFIEAVNRAIDGNWTPEPVNNPPQPPAPSDEEAMALGHA